MYNKFLEKYLAYAPEKVISKKGVTIRKVISPILRFVVPFVTPNSKLTVVRRAKMSKNPVIFAATHGFREDAEHTVVMAGRQAYMLNGSISQVFKSFDGITAWIAGMVLVDRTDKESRASAVSKLVRALELGSSVIIFPEGTWNKSPNELISGLFPGIYDVAKTSGALVVPIATYRNGKRSYGISEEAFDICQYTKEEGMQILRDKMATMQYELMENYGTGSRDEFPYGEAVDKYWDDFINGLMAEAEFYDYDIELYTKYRPKGVTTPKDAFAFMEDLKPNWNNAFLFRGMKNRNDIHNVGVDVRVLRKDDSNRQKYNY